MNQKAIWLIIGLLSAAVIGVMVLQLNFINKNIRVNEENFDGHVREALKVIAKQMEESEDFEVSRFANGFSIKQMRSDSNVISFSSATIVSNNPQLLDQNEAVFRQLKASKFSTPIEERINLPQLGMSLKKELSQRGINIPYNYGVFSNSLSSFVIFNNNFVMPDAMQKAFDFLKESEYKTDIFSNGFASPGYLTLHFNTKASVVWGGLWKTLLLSMLFVAIILGCFGYTIYVIQRQKNLGEMKNDFINNMTHEFKTPIATISLAADSINSPTIIGNPDKVRRFVDIIKQENKRMNGQVEKVLQMALIEREKIKLNFSQIDMNEIINQAVANISLQVEKKDGTVSSDLKAKKTMIEGDLNHISNVINNLLDNANKYSPESPEIKVTTRNISNGIEISVSDKGIGMTKEAKKRIFEKFYRVPTGNLHDVKGFGLGLTYVKTMVTAHKGSVDVKSEPGKGSSFILFFPFQVNEGRDGAVSLN
jgi:two-component system, OmpR family, phosphate regulon sensor histidine kinase PhoR